MHWGMRALLVALFGMCVFASAWAYENWYFLLFVKRLVSLFEPPNYDDFRLLITQQPTTSVVPIIIAVPPKQGTTWLGHICYQVRSRGAPIPERDQMLDMPYIEKLPMDEGKVTEWRNFSGRTEPPFWNLSSVEPHLLRTHLELPVLKEVGFFPRYRVLTLFREPMDAAASAYRFFPNIFYIRHELINPDVFARMLLLTFYDKSLHNMVEYWEQRHDPRVLIVFFEELKDDLPGMIRTVAKFIDMSPPLSEQELLNIESQCTYSTMSGLKKRFGADEGDVILKKLGLSRADADLTARGDGLLVRTGGGKKGEGKHVFSEEIQKEMQARWHSIVTTKTGMQNFTQFKDVIRGLRAGR